MKSKSKSKVKVKAKAKSKSKAKSSSKSKPAKKSTKKPAGFRKGVVGVFIKPNGKILMGERLKDKGQWQLPQGGIEGKETPVQALRREMSEEVGIEGFDILYQTKKYIRYEWPKGLFPKAKHLGQEHLYFLLDGEGIKPKELPVTEEFRRFKWFTVAEVLEDIVKFKKPGYKKAFKKLGIL